MTRPAPSPLDAQALAGALAGVLGAPWRPLRHLQRCDSTQREMRAWLEREPAYAGIETAGAWRVVVADEQTAGRGRRGRTWVAPTGGALLMTLASPLPLPAAVWPRASLIVGAALVDALEQIGAVAAGSLRLKWPNDVLARGPRAMGKIAGVLCERWQPRGRSNAVWLCGVGLNLRAPAGGWPEAAGAALALEDCAGAASVTRPPDDQLALALLEQIRRHVVRWARGDGALPELARLEAKLAGVGHPIAWRMAPEQRLQRGRLLGLDPSGALRVAVGDGRAGPPQTSTVTPWQIEHVEGPDAWHHPRPRGGSAPGRTDAADD